MALSSDRLNELIKYYSGQENRSEIVGALQRQLDEALARETNEQALTQALAQGKGAEFLTEQNSPFYQKPDYTLRMPNSVPTAPDYKGNMPSFMPSDMQNQFYTAAAQQREIERQQEEARKAAEYQAYLKWLRDKKKGTPDDGSDGDGADDNKDVNKSYVFDYTDDALDVYKSSPTQPNIVENKKPDGKVASAKPINGDFKLSYDLLDLLPSWMTGNDIPTATAAENTPPVQNTSGSDIDYLRQRAAVIKNVSDEELETLYNTYKKMPAGSDKMKLIAIANEHRARAIDRAVAGAKANTEADRLKKQKPAALGGDKPTFGSY